MSYEQGTAIATARKNVQITSSDGKVNLDSVTVSRDGGDEVTWVSDGTRKALIVFASPDGSPFQETHFHVPAGGSISSGPARSDAAYKAYKYTVIGETGVNDPVVIVDQ